MFLNGASSNETFSFDNIKNPPTTYPSDAFNFTVTAENGGDVYQFNDWDYNITVRMWTPNKLRNVSLAQNSLEAGVNTTYTISFTTFNPIPEGGDIYIIPP